MNTLNNASCPPLNNRQKIREIYGEYVLEIILVILCIVLSLFAKNFLTVGNVLNVLRNVAMQGIIAFGMTMVIISGEIDLSVASTVAFSGCLTAKLILMLTPLGVPIVWAVIISILITLTLTFLFGCFIAFLRNRFNVPSFITTLAMMTGLYGVSMLMTNGFSVTSFPNWFSFFGSGYIIGIPFPAIVFILMFALIFFVMTYTSFGRAVYAVGGNSEASRLSGINVKRVRIVVLGLTEMLAGLSGIMLASQIMSGTPTVGKGWEMNVISAVIIGGTSLFGGSGKIRGTLTGVIFLGVLLNGMTILNINEYWQYVVKGILILSAVLINTVQMRKK